MSRLIRLSPKRSRHWVPSLVVAAVLGLVAPGAAGASQQDVAEAVDPAVLSARMAEQGSPVLVLDVRGRGEYLQGTVPGARHVGPSPVGVSVTSAVDDVVMLASQPPDASVVEAWRKHLAARGVTLGVLAGGLPAWRAAGLPVAMPEPDYAVPGQVQFQIPRGSCEPREPVQRFSAPDDRNPIGTTPSSVPPIREAPP